MFIFLTDKAGSEAWGDFRDAGKFIDLSKHLDMLVTQHSRERSGKK
jgi:hypothetical protein